MYNLNKFWLIYLRLRTHVTTLYILDLLMVFLRITLVDMVNRTIFGQIVHVGGVLKLLEPADFKTDPGFDNCPRFVGVIEQNKI